MDGKQFLVGGGGGIVAEGLHWVVEMQVVGGHIPLGFFQRTDVLVHREVEATVLVKIVVFHFLCVEVDIGAVVRGGEGHIGRVGRIEQEVGRVGHKSPGVQGEMVGVELRQAETQLTISGIAVGSQNCLTREIGVAIHADGVVDGLGGQLGRTHIPFQP